MAACACSSGHELWRSYLSSLLRGSPGFLRFGALTAHTSLIYRNQRGCMTEQTHIFLITHYHSEMTSALLAGGVQLHLGSGCTASIRLLSRVKSPRLRIESCKYWSLQGRRKRRKTTMTYEWFLLLPF